VFSPRQRWGSHPQFSLGFAIPPLQAFPAFAAEILLTISIGYCLARWKNY
jgi:hypothetical protein